MRKIINNRVYDTRTAKYIGHYQIGSELDSFYQEETLFKKRTGEYFIFAQGGTETKFAVLSNGKWVDGRAIYSLTYEEARAWAEENLDLDEYNAEFGPISEIKGKAVITVNLEGKNLAKLRRLAQIDGISISEEFDKLITKELKKEGLTEDDKQELS